MKQMANSVHVKHSLTLLCILYRTDQSLLNYIKSRIKEDVENVAQTQQYSFRNAYGRTVHSTQYILSKSLASFRLKRKSQLD